MAIYENAAARFWRWLMKPTVLAVGAMIAGSVAIVLCTLALNAGSEDKTSDWISAFGTAFGAALTGGAVLFAAFTYQHQVDEKNRVQADERQRALDERSEHARAIKLNNTPSNEYHDTWDYVVRNDSDIPVDGVDILSFDRMAGEATLHQIGTVNPTEQSRPKAVYLPDMTASYLRFQDKNGRNWRKYFDGRLEEQVTTQVASDTPTGE
ncbi:hypothetical protein QFZ36_000535 [Pseudarthrobacter siccitolerans]|uniref:Lipoprotein n=1 Tax=Pseudarthrobacter siccitolerans TaxID=861266 RepID=A0ABU0PG77_9MICC|nr:hypothetical protein [Pseudarthrobacter siccitolerans]MDQ0672974.1 hypothetical protein [Pseudarthrobacter siccitolerans]